MPDNNEKAARQIAKGVETWDYSGQAVAAHIVSMHPDHQRRIADMVFHLVRMWARMDTIGHGPEHPMYREWEQARRMLTSGIEQS